MSISSKTRPLTVNALLRGLFLVAAYRAAVPRTVVHRQTNQLDSNYLKYIVTGGRGKAIIPFQLMADTQRFGALRRPLSGLDRDVRLGADRTDEPVAARETQEEARRLPRHKQVRACHRSPRRKRAIRLVSDINARRRLPATPNDPQWRRRYSPRCAWRRYVFQLRSVRPDRSSLAA